jgi:hypothetical protein
MLDSARLDVEEMAAVYPFYHHSYKVLGPWLAARILPAYRHQAELRNSIALDVPSEITLPSEHHGWRATGGPESPEELQRNLQLAFNQYQGVLADPVLEAQPARALHNLLAFCSQQHIPAALVIPPESAFFRNAYQDTYGETEDYIGRIAVEFDVPLYDARTWVDDDGFLDGHHLWVKGADQFTQRFEREAFLPALRRLGAERMSWHGPEPHDPTLPTAQQAN